MNQSKIFGYENVTHYLHFAENPIRFHPVVTKKCDFFVKNVKSPFCPSFDKLPAQNAQNEFKLLLNGREMKLPPCFCPL